MNGPRQTKIHLRESIPFLFLLLLPAFLLLIPPGAISGEGPVKTDGNEIKIDEAAIAAMSDEEVRKSYLLHIRQEAEIKNAQAGDKEPDSGLSRYIQDIKNWMTFLKGRVIALRNDKLTAESGSFSGIMAYLTTGTDDPSPMRAVLSVVILFAAAFLVDWGFKLATKIPGEQFKQTASSKTVDKLMGLLSLGVLDFVSICLFIAVTLLLFFIFMDRTISQRVLVAAYLAAIVIIRLCRLVLNILLAPKTENLRVFPISNGAAVYLYQGLMAFFSVGSLGFLTCGVMQIAGAGNADHFLMISMVSMVMAIILGGMILHQRKPVGEILTGASPAHSLRAKLARYWHLGALFMVFFGLVGSVFNHLLYGKPGLSGVKAVLLIGFWLLLDWLIRRASVWAFDLVQKPRDFREMLRSDKTGGFHENPAEPKATAKDDSPGAGELPHMKKEEINRLNQFLTNGLRAALAASMLFWLLNLWGMDLPIGQAFADAAFDILVTLVICYVAWELFNSAIQRRIREEIPDADEDIEEGSSGGSRIGTLLVLFRKFMAAVFLVILTMIVLSRLGVDIGPLIAGAGVVGLAVGFGAQTLVKDVISGLFFLIDDAFRVGDFVEVGSTKGTVEQISIRSLKLRHPRGMLSTIPFGDMGQILNFSRDYIITKLDFRVRYDTNVEKVRKIIKKKVYKPIMDNEELAPKLLDKIKSQGVRQLEDSAMIMRVKFKTIPGEQFVVRKEVLHLMKEAFAKEGIEFAHRNVTVYLPDEKNRALGENENQRKKAGAAAAIASERRKKAPEDSSEF